MKNSLHKYVVLIEDEKKTAKSVAEDYLPSVRQALLSLNVTSLSYST